MSDQAPGHQPSGVMRRCLPGFNSGIPRFVVFARFCFARLLFDRFGSPDLFFCSLGLWLPVVVRPGVFCSRFGPPLRRARGPKHMINECSHWGFGGIPELKPGRKRFVVFAPDEKTCETKTGENVRIIFFNLCQSVSNFVIFFISFCCCSLFFVFLFFLIFVFFYFIFYFFFSFFKFIFDIISFSFFFRYVFLYLLGGVLFSI